MPARPPRPGSASRLRASASTRQRPATTLGARAALDDADVGGRLVVEPAQLHRRDGLRSRRRSRCGPSSGLIPAWDASPGTRRRASCRSGAAVMTSPIGRRRDRARSRNSRAQLADLERVGAAQALLLRDGEDQLDPDRARLGGQARAELHDHRDRCLVVGAEDRLAGAAEDAVVSDDLDRLVMGNGVHVGEEGDPPLRVSAPRDPRDQVVRLGARRAGCLVGVELDPQLGQLGGDDVGDERLGPVADWRLTEAHEALKQLPLAHSGWEGTGAWIRRSGEPRSSWQIRRSPRPRSPPSRRLTSRRHPAGGTDELAEQRLRARRARVELGVELRGDEERVVRQLDDLDEALVRRGAAHHEPLVLDPATEHVVDLVAMAVALVDDGLAVEDLARPRALVELHRIGAKAHRPAEVGDLLLLGQQVDDRDRASRDRTRPSWRPPCRRRGGRSRRRPSASQGRSRGRGSRSRGRSGRRSTLPSMPRSPKPPGMRIPSAFSRSVGVELLGADEVDLDVDAVMEAAVLERLDHRLVGVLELHVLADERDPHGALGGVGAATELLPVGQVGRGRLDRRSGRGRGRRCPRRGTRAAPCRCCRRRGRRCTAVLGKRCEERDLAADLAVEPALGAADHARGAGCRSGAAR